MKIVKIGAIGLLLYLAYKKLIKDPHDADINRIPSAVEINNALTAHSKADAAELYKMCKNASSLSTAQKNRIRIIFRNIGFPSVMDAEYSKLSGGSFGNEANRLFDATFSNDLNAIASGISKKGIFAIEAANGTNATIYRSSSTSTPQNLTASGTVKGKTYLGRLVKSASGHVSYYGNDGNIYWIPQSAAYLVEIN